MPLPPMGSVERSPQFHARLAGWLYLAVIGLGLFGEMVVRGTLVVPGDAAATAQRIAASPSLWRAGIAADLLMQACDVPMIVIFYLLLRPVSRSLSLLAAAFNGVQTAVLALNKLNLLVPLLLLDSTVHAKALPVQQLQALSYLAIQAHTHGFAIGLIFFGFTCVLSGYLIMMSGYFPKVLGILMQIAGVSYLANSFALILAPSFASLLLLVPAFVGELSLCLWLIVKGVHVEPWERRLGLPPARAAAG